MNTVWLSYLKGIEEDVVRMTRRQVDPWRRTGGAAHAKGIVAEQELAECISGIVPAQARVVGPAFICDGQNRRTEQPVDVLVLRPIGLRATYRFRTLLVSVDSVSAAIEVKGVLNPTSLRSVLRQLMEVKRLQQTRRQKYDRAQGAPSFRGNVFCGAVFLDRQGRKFGADRVAGTVKEIIENWQQMWTTPSPADRQVRQGPPDAGRYPNFLWLWQEWIILKRYKRGDFPSPVPGFFECKKILQFKAPSVAIDTKTGERTDDETVEYVLIRAPEATSDLTLLAFMQHRLSSEVHAVGREEVALADYLF